MLRTFKTLAIAGTMTLVLAACGSGGESTDASGAAGASGAADGLKGTGTGAECTIATPIPVGAALSLTGAAASYGESQKKGLELAAEALAKNDKIKYDLKIEDDQTDPRQGITLFEALTKDKSVIIGPTLSNTAFQAQPVAQEKKVPVLAISNTAAGITEQGDYIFRDSLTEGQVIPQTVAKATEAYGLKKVVVMYSNDDAFTESGFKVFEAALKDEGVEIAQTLTFSKADTDFRPLLTEAKASQPDALVVSGLIEAAIPLVTQARELGLDMPIIGGNGFNNPKLMSDGGEAAEGVVVGAAWNSASEGELNTAFLKDFEAKFGAQPDQFAAQAYTGLMVIDAAVKANCSGEREDIKSGLGQIKDLDTVLGTFSINADRDAEHDAVVQVVKDGAFTVLN
ncbi:MAG: ABC transporter substrate-binding protein [Ornithinimicrobium sp.]|uniref:ABC transporter substrate-binding protein n=1 Tax=Ornithinimicrobium sp. TaxID=1977084 RepID=UPI0026DEB03E|nr:ABC transporter substrate-binding protein [Ornithinimicrobium sp.]MDO5739334.1 ABC transporter substrate-binding protein [Ornithinimicrobium sp.]